MVIGFGKTADVTKLATGVPWIWAQSNVRLDDNYLNYSGGVVELYWLILPRKKSGRISPEENAADVRDPSANPLR